MQIIRLLLCILVISGCTSSRLEYTLNQFDKEFFSLSTIKQMGQFQKYDLETRYKLLIIGNQIVHPPALYLVEEFAKQGIVVIPILNVKLAETKQELTIRDIVAVLADMQRLGTYDVKNDQALMYLVQNRVASMHGPWKPIAQEMLNKIHD